eukprot:670571-Prorocentrum_minimum.AAC.1
MRKRVLIRRSGAMRKRVLIRRSGADAGPDPFATVGCLAGALGQFYFWSRPLGRHDLEVLLKGFDQVRYTFVTPHHRGPTHVSHRTPHLNTPETPATLTASCVFIN